MLRLDSSAQRTEAAPNEASSSLNIPTSSGPSPSPSKLNTSSNSADACVRQWLGTKFCTAAYDGAIQKQANTEDRPMNTKATGAVLPAIVNTALAGHSKKSACKGKATIEPTAGIHSCHRLSLSAKRSANTPLTMVP